MAAFVIVNAAPPARSRQSASVFRSPVIAGKTCCCKARRSRTDVMPATSR